MLRVNEGVTGEAALLWIGGDIGKLIAEVFGVADAMLVEACLPDFAGNCARIA